MKRVKQINISEEYLYKVTKVWLFGSYLRPDVTELNDIDIGIELTSKYSDPTIRIKKDLEYSAMAMQNGQRLSSLINKLSFPQEEIKKILRNKSQYISLHTTSDQVLKHTETLQIYPKSLIAKLTDLLS